PSESVELDRSGELRRNSSGPSFQRSNANGRFEFLPKYDPNMVVAANSRGYAQVLASNFATTGKVVLEPWGTVKGVVRVPRSDDRGFGISLQSTSGRSAEAGRNYPALNLSYKTDPDSDGRFEFQKVPPGERKVYLQYKLNEPNPGGRLAFSHGVPVTVKPNEVAEVVIGGTGRSIKGKIVPVGVDPEDLDWKRDVNTLNSMVTLPPSVGPVAYTPNMTQEEQQEVWRAYREREAAFWRTPEGQKLDREQRGYFLLFET